MTKQIRFIRLRDLLARRSTSRSAAYRSVKDGTLTPPVKLGPGTSAWPEHEIDAIDRARLAGATDDDVRKLVSSLIEARKAA